MDADATLVTAHSDHKQGAAGTYKHSFGFHPLLAYLDRASPPAQQRQHSRSATPSQTPPTATPPSPHHAS